jgi:hypothetical protein
LAVLIVWAPLLVLSAIESLVLEKNKLGALIVDLTVIFRYLIAVPLFMRKVRFFGSDRLPAILSMPEMPEL